MTAGVRRVVVGVQDPDPRVAGRGIAALRAAGVEVSVGEASADIAAQLEPYLVHRETGRPFVILKLAATMDGRIAGGGRYESLDHGAGGSRRCPPASRRK